MIATHTLIHWLHLILFPASAQPRLLPESTMTYLTVMWHKVTVRKILFSLKLTGLHPTCLWGPMNTLVVFETPKNGRKQARIEVGGNSVWSKSAI